MIVSRIRAVAIASLFAYMGCTSSKEHLLRMDESQVKLRKMQTRAFDTVDKVSMLRTVISTLQDLGYIVNEANEVIGSITAYRSGVVITVTVRPRGETQLLVRANAQFGLNAVEKPLVYQNFFNVLGKSIFLTAHEVD